MNTAQQADLAQAQQGNPEAIAALMRKQLAEKGIKVRVSRSDDVLTVALGSAQVLPKASSLNFVRSGLICLGVKNIRAVQVQGYKLGVAEPVWIDRINLATHSKDLGKVEDILKSKNSNNQAKKNTPAYVWIIGGVVVLLMTNYVASLFTPSDLTVELGQLADKSEAALEKAKKPEAERAGAKKSALDELMSKFEQARLDHAVALESAQRVYQQEVHASQDQMLNDLTTNRNAELENNHRLAEAELKLVEAKVQAAEKLKAENESLLASPLVWEVLDGVTDSKGQPIGPDTPLAELEAALAKL